MQAEKYKVGKYNHVREESVQRVGDYRHQWQQKN